MTTRPPPYGRAQRARRCTILRCIPSSEDSTMFRHTIGFPDAVTTNEPRPEVITRQLRNMRRTIETLTNRDAAIESGIQRIQQVQALIESDVIPAVNQDEAETAEQFLEVCQMLIERARWSQKITAAQALHLQNHYDELHSIAAEWNMQSEYTRSALVDSNTDGDGTTYIQTGDAAETPTTPLSNHPDTF